MLDDKIVGIIVQAGFVGLAFLALWKLPSWLNLAHKNKQELVKQIQDGHETIQKNCDERTRLTNEAFGKVVTSVDKNTEVTQQLVLTLKDNKK